MTRTSFLSPVFTAALTVLTVTCLTPAARAANPECAGAIQNRIAWDYNGNTQWNPANIDRLCAGTSAPAEPARCFNTVMHNQVNWGGGTEWKWQNAIDLCAGTNYAANTVACFQTLVGAGKSWPSAIQSCNGPVVKSPPSNVSVTLAFVNRTSAPVDVVWIDFDGSRKNYGSLASGERRDQQTFRGHTWYFQQQGKVIGRMVASSYNRQPVVIEARDAGEGPIWSTVDAQQKCPSICDRQGRTWTGDWTTVVQGQSSVCRCVAVSGSGSF
jgi:hypothetical protein